jgi:hypothetical protein
MVSASTHGARKSLSSNKRSDNTYDLENVQSFDAIDRERREQNLKGLYTAKTTKAIAARKQSSTVTLSVNDNAGSQTLNFDFDFDEEASLHGGPDRTSNINNKVEIRSWSPFETDSTHVNYAPENQEMDARSLSPFHISALNIRPTPGEPVGSINSVQRNDDQRYGDQRNDSPINIKPLNIKPQKKVEPSHSRTESHFQQIQYYHRPSSCYGEGMSQSWPIANGSNSPFDNGRDDDRSRSPFDVRPDRDERAGSPFDVRSSVDLGRGHCKKRSSTYSTQNPFQDEDRNFSHR